MRNHPHPPQKQDPTIRNKPLNQTPQNTDKQNICVGVRRQSPVHRFSTGSWQLIPTYLHTLPTPEPRDLLNVRSALGGGGLLRLCDGVPVVFVIRGGGC